MCGICGIYRRQDDKSPHEEFVRDMLSAISHRGPDGSRTLVKKRIALGFNRLSFLDIKGGMQPISNEDGTVFLICNGEIFNYDTLRAHLRAAGHTFATGTDVEVIVHLYEEYGKDFVTRLNGQFAIALYDEKKGELILARDPVGIAPLFYTEVDGVFLFASEIKALLRYPGVPRRLNLTAVDQLMNFPGIVSPATFFDGIYSLEAGHMLSVRAGHEIQNETYWDLRYDMDETDLGEEFYVDGLRSLILDAVKRRLVADVPIGFYVSGGLDSSVVACYIGKYLLNSSYSFSAEVGGEDLNERHFQQIVHERTGSIHYHTRVTEKEILENLPHVICQAETAVKESYDVAAYLLSALVQSSPAKAVLTGQGADEFFYGYVGYLADQFRAMQKNQMSSAECEVNERLWGDPYFRYERNHPQIRKIHEKLYSGDVLSELPRFFALNESPLNPECLKGLSTQKRRSYIDLKLRLSDHLLGEHGDRMFFAHSVEGRHPFLDSALLNFVIKIPDKYKLKGSNEKYILKKAGKGIVPDEILKRKKFPFQAPGMSSMIKQPGNIKYLDEALIRKYGVFNPDYVRELKGIYSQSDFKLMGAYEIDYLLIVMTVTMLCEQYSLSL